MNHDRRGKGMKLFFKIVATLLIFQLSACTDKPDTPEEKVELFIKNGSYELLSVSDQASVSEEEWNKKKSSLHPSESNLSPTSEYFELERYLRSFASVNVETTTKTDKEGNQIVSVDYAIPAVLSEVHFFSEYAMEYKLQEISNLQNLFDKGLLTDDNVKIQTRKQEFKVNDTGIVLGMDQVMKAKAIKSQLEPIFERFFPKHQSYINVFSHLNFSDWAADIKKIRKIGKAGLEKGIEQYESLIKKLKDAESSNSTYTYLRELEVLYKAKKILAADELFLTHLDFTKAEVADSTSGKKGLFYEWSYNTENDTHPKLGLKPSIKVQYFDEDGHQIGSEVHKYTNIDLTDGSTAGSVGRKIDNQMMARRAIRAEISYHVPFGILDFKCSSERKPMCREG